MTQQPSSRSRSAERLVWLGLLFFLLVMLIITLYRSFGLERNLLETREALLQARLQLAKYTEQATLASATPGLRDYQARKLRQRGLSDPDRDLLTDLMRQPELIPHEPVLGGTLRFIPQDTYVLNDRWVLTTFEDGHVRGQMLLQYAVANGHIAWRVLASFLD